MKHSGCGITHGPSVAMYGRRLIPLIAAMLLSVITSVLPAHGQKLKWELKYDSPIYGVRLSPSNEYVLYTYEKGLTNVLECVSVADGKRIWSKTLVESGPVLEFIDTNRLIVGHDGRYDFITVKDGVVRSSLPIIGETWDDLILQRPDPREYERLGPLIRDSIGIFYFSNGMQIIDLLEEKMIYQTECDFDHVRYGYWERMMLINECDDCDSIYVLDRKNRTMVFKASRREQLISNMAYQSFVSSGNEVLLFNDDNMTSVDVTTGKINTSLAIDPDDPDMYIPIFPGEGQQMLLLTSQGDRHRLYETKSGNLIWQTDSGALGGVVDDIVLLEHEEAILYSYDGDGLTSACKIDMKNGALLWKLPLFRQKGTYRPGHVRRLSAIFAHDPPERRKWEPSYLGFDPVGNDYRYASLAKGTEGYVRMIGIANGRLNIITVGKIHDPAANAREHYNGEKFMTIDLNDGKILASQAIDVLKNSDEPDFDAFWDSQPNIHNGSYIVLGLDKVYIFRGENMIHYDFPGLMITKVDRDSNETLIRTRSWRGDTLDYWRIDVSDFPPNRYLLVRTFAPNIERHTLWQLDGTLLISPDDITMYPLATGEISEKTFMNPRWRLTADRLGVGDIPENLSGQGVLAASNGDIVVGGSDAITLVSESGKCRTNYEWLYGRPSSFELYECDRGLIFDATGEAGLLPNICNDTVFAAPDIERYGSNVLPTYDRYAFLLASWGRRNCFLRCYSLR